MSDLAEYLRDNPDRYNVDEYGIICDLGKFESEPLYVPFFYDVGLDGGADDVIDHTDETISEAFFLSEAERAAHRDLGEAEVVVLHYRDSGFIDSELATRAEFEAWSAECAAGTDEEYV